MSCKLRKIRRDNNSYLPTNNCPPKKSCINPCQINTCIEPCRTDSYLDSNQPCTAPCELVTSIPNCPPSTIETRLCAIENSINSILNQINCQPVKSCEPVCSIPPPPCEPNPNCPPPIIFDGYEASLRKITVNCNQCEYWFLIPNQCTNNDTYKFYWCEKLCKYIYEPVFPNDFTRAIPYCFDNNYHITYVYDDLGQYGWGLRPLKYIDKLCNPLSISAYRYTSIPIVGYDTYVWSFIPVPFCFSEPIVPNFFQPLTYPCKSDCLPEPINLCYSCDSSNTCPDPCNSTLNIVNEIKNSQLCAYSKCINYKFDPITSGVYYNVNSANIGPNVFKFASSILDCNGNTECILVTPNFMGFLLPSDCNKYNISWLPELRINSTASSVAPMIVAPIYALAGPSNITADIDGTGKLPANCNIELSIFSLDDNCNVINTEVIATSVINWQSMCTTPATGLDNIPPANFTVFQTTINQNLISYYKSCATTNCVKYCNSKDCFKKLLIIRVTAGFSIENVKVEINRILC